MRQDPNFSLAIVFSLYLGFKPHVKNNNAKDNYHSGCMLSDAVVCSAAVWGQTLDQVISGVKNAISHNHTRRKKWNGCFITWEHWPRPPRAPVSCQPVKHPQTVGLFVKTCTKQMRIKSFQWHTEPPHLVFTLMLLNCWEVMLQYLH